MYFSKSYNIAKSKQLKNFMTSKNINQYPMYTLLINFNHFLTLLYFLFNPQLSSRYISVPQCHLSAWTQNQPIFSHKNDCNHYTGSHFNEQIDIFHDRCVDSLLKHQSLSILPSLKYQLQILGKGQGKMMFLRAPTILLPP